MPPPAILQALQAAAQQQPQIPVLHPLFKLRMDTAVAVLTALINLSDPADGHAADVIADRCIKALAYTDQLFKTENDTRVAAQQAAQSPPADETQS